MVATPILPLELINILGVTSPFEKNLIPSLYITDPTAVVLKPPVFQCIPFVGTISTPAVDRILPVTSNVDDTV